MFNSIIEALEGKEFDFYGVYGHCFNLNGKVFEALEDESDGYRSYLASVELRNEQTKDMIFFPNPVARVRVEQDGDTDDEGFCLKRVEDGFVVLRVFTDYTDDYYPCFRFEYLLPNAPRLPFKHPTKFDALAALLD